jgi:hypothetical protein
MVIAVSYTEKLEKVKKKLLGERELRVPMRMMTVVPTSQSTWVPERWVLMLWLRHCAPMVSVGMPY